jgi:hypothetical protein
MRIKASSETDYIFNTWNLWSSYISFSIGMRFTQRWKLSSMNLNVLVSLIGFLRSTCRRFRHISFFSISSAFIPNKIGCDCPHSSAWLKAECLNIDELTIRWICSWVMALSTPCTELHIRFNVVYIVGGIWRYIVRCWILITFLNRESSSWSTHRIFIISLKICLYSTIRWICTWWFFIMLWESKWKNLSFLCSRIITNCKSPFACCFCVGCWFWCMEIQGHV